MRVERLIHSGFVGGGWPMPDSSDRINPEGCLWIRYGASMFESVLQAVQPWQATNAQTIGVHGHCAEPVTGYLRYAAHQVDQTFSPEERDLATR